MSKKRTIGKAGGSRPQTTGRSRSRRTAIALLNESSDNPYATDVLWGVTDGAEEQDALLICLAGGVLRDPVGFSAQANVLYDLLSPESVDGLLIVASTLGTYIDHAELLAFFGRYSPLPVVSVGLSVDSIPSVLVDNYTGVHDAIVHLIEVHGARRIAFIRGPEGHEEAEARYRAYTDALAEHRLALDPSLVVPGDFRLPAGREAISLLLDQRKAAFDAVVAANDIMALSAMAALQERGIRVPYDVALVGFDDVEEVRLVTPPLTTVRQPVHEMGRRAVEMVLLQIAGEDAPSQVVLPTEVVIRQSCGCAPSAAVQLAVGPAAGVPKGPRSGEALEVALAEQREQIASEMVEAVQEAAAGMDAGWAGRLLDDFVTAVTADSSEDLPGPFLYTLDEMLCEVAVAGGDVARWQGVLSALRRGVLHYLDEEQLLRAGTFWEQAYIMVREVAQRVQAYEAFQAERRAGLLREIGAALIATFHVEELMDVLAEELPRLGVPGAYLSLYEDLSGPQGWSRLVLAYDRSARVDLDPGGQRFPSDRLAPEGVLPQDRQCSLIVEALYCREHSLGFALFEVGPREGTIYGALRAEISSALEQALLFQAREKAEADLEKAYAEVEKQVRERTAELEHEIAERVRAQEENLRLQQEVIEAQRRSIQELSTPIIPVMDRVLVMPLVGTVDTLRAREITRAVLAGIREHRAKVVILDVTGVPLLDTAVANHLNKTIQAARLKGAHTIMSGISDEVAETVVELGIDWSWVETVSDLQTGLVSALSRLGFKLSQA